MNCSVTMESQSTESFIDLFTFEIDRAITSIDDQTAIINIILEKSLKIVLQLSDILKSNKKINENDVKYNVKQKTLQNLVEIVENYSRIISLKQNYQSEDLMSRNVEFSDFQQNMRRKAKYLENCVKRLQALRDNVRKIQTDHNSLTEMEIVTSDYTDDENDS